MNAAPSRKTSEIEKEIINYLQHLKSNKETSSLTVRNYSHYLNRFNNWLEKQGMQLKIKDLNPELVRQYATYLSHLTSGKNPLSRKTQGYHLIALRSFIRWLNKSGQIAFAVEQIDIPKSQSSKIKFLTGKQVDRLLNAPSLSTIQGKRDKTILEVLYSTGLRLSDLVNLNRSNIDLEKKELKIIKGDRQERVVFLSSRALIWIDLYLKARDDQFSPLFISHKGKVDPSTQNEKMRLSCRSVQRMIKKYVRKIKLPVDASPQVLRHSFATDLLMAGADIRSVQEMMGHKNIQTTQIYTHLAHRQLPDVHETFHGN